MDNEIAEEEAAAAKNDDGKEIIKEEKLRKKSRMTPESRRKYIERYENQWHIKLNPTEANQLIEQQEAANYNRLKKEKH